MKFERAKIFILTYLIMGLIIWLMPIPYRNKLIINIIFVVIGMFVALNTRKTSKKNSNILFFISGFNFLICIFVTIIFFNAINNVITPEVEVGIKLPKGLKPIELKEKESSFLGDGSYYAVYELNDEQVSTIKKDILNQNKWHEMPMKADIVYIARRFLNSSLENGEIKNDMLVESYHGFYFFKDRLAEQSEEISKEPFWQRSSYNFTLAMLDIDNNRLYIYTVDT